MDGSVSTLAPLFAAAFATHSTWETFLVGMAASVGAGISMGFAEALSDDGSLTGRGTPWLRGTVCGLMTTIGGVGHTLPYLIPDFWIATIIAIAVVAVELAVDLLDPLSLHGHAVPLGRVSGHGRRRAGVPRRDIDRQLVACVVACSCWRTSSDPHLAPLPTPASRRAASASAGSAISTGCASAARSIGRSAGGARRRSQGAGARPHRGHRRSGQSLADQRIRAGAGLARTARRAGPTSTFVPGNHDAYVRAAAGHRRARLGRLHARRRRRDAFRSCGGAGRWR